MKIYGWPDTQTFAVNRRFSKNESEIGEVTRIKAKMGKHIKRHKGGQ